MRGRMKRLFPLLFLACSSAQLGAAHSELDGAEYRFELRARSSEDPFDPSGTFALPRGAWIKDITPSLNDRGDVAIDYLAFDGQHHVWKNGVNLYDVPDPKAVLGGTSINLAGDVAFDVMGGATGNGIWLHRASTGTTGFFSAEPLGSDSWVNVRLTENGRVGCRAGAADQRFLGYPEEKGFTRIAIEASSNPNSPYKYLFTPSFDDHDHTVAKVWLVSGGNEIRLFTSPPQPSPDGEGVTRGAPVRTLAQDQAANPNSPYTTLDNGPALNNAGQVAFIAKAGARRGVFRTDGTTTVTIAVEGEDGVASIGWFNPVLNDAGIVAFKGESADGKNTIWAGDGARLRKVVTVGDVLPTDSGDASPSPETGFDPNNRIAFGGGIRINARGQIVFSASLGRGEKRLGTGIYVATPIR
jgi:hypothetical protein